MFEARVRSASASRQAWGVGGSRNFHTFDFQHGFGNFLNMSFRQFRWKNLSEAAFHFVHVGGFGFAKAEEFSVVAADDGQEFLFLSIALNNSQTMNTMVTPAVPIGVGGVWRAGGIIEAFPGCIGAVRVMSGVLTAADVTNNFNAGLLAKPIPTKPLALAAAPGDTSALRRRHRA
jgi:hypothetical protein